MSDDQFFATGVEGLTVYIGDLAQDQAVSDFWRTTAIPYFREARDKGHVESMAYGNTFS